MLTHLVEVSATALPVALIWAALAAAAGRWGGDRGVRGLLVLSGAGLLGALVLSVLRRRTNWINRELISLGLLGVCLVLGVAVLVWLWLPASRQGRPPRWGSHVLAGLAGVYAFFALPDIMLLSVGLFDTGGSVWTTEVTLNVGGYVLGLALVGVSVWAVHRAAAGAPLAAMRWGVTGVLVLALVSQLTTLVQILLARRLIKVSSEAFQVIAWLLNHKDWVTWLLVVVSLVPAVASVIAHARARRTFANPAQARLHRAEGLSRRRFLVIAGTGFSLTVVLATLGRQLADTEPTLSPPEPLSSDAEQVWVELSAINDGHLHRFAYTATGGTEVRFIAIQKNAHAFGVGLDACDVCGPTGYYERDGQVICKLCDVAMNVSTIGFKGGCNPIPLEYQLQDGRLVVARSALEASAGVFA